MDNAELDVALEELENRLERLRALYEQYFMGIERIEPQIPRKDVDRRIYVLRREKIRNTAKRFKLQTIISRYNTFQQYWQRICREIENGTYKRHVLKAERIAPGQMLTITARKRLGRQVFQEAEEGEPATAGPSSAPLASSSLPPRAPSSLPPRGPSSLPPSVPRPASSPPGIPRPAPAAAGPTPKVAPPPRPPPKPGARPAKPTEAPAAAAKPFESLDLDMDFMGDWDPFATTEKPVKADPKPQPGPPKAFGEALARPLGTPPKPVARSAPAAGAPVPGKPAAATLAKPLGAIPAPKPQPAAAPAPPKPQPAAAPAKPTTAKPVEPAPAIDERVRELHARLVEAKKQTKDSATVSVEGLAKSLKATEAKLREQHKDRKIEFDVVIKDGKAVLKPIVR